jgi:hypothetical protein
MDWENKRIWIQELIMKPEIVITDLANGIENLVREMTDEEYAVYLQMVENTNPLPITNDE